jgi:hypothetical protein
LQAAKKVNAAKTKSASATAMIFFITCYLLCFFILFL